MRPGGGLDFLNRPPKDCVTFGTKPTTVNAGLLIINQLANGDYAIESVVPKAGINLVIPALTEAGATDLLEIPISKIVH